MPRHAGPHLDWTTRREIERRMRGRIFRELSRSAAVAIVRDSPADVIAAADRLRATPADVLFVARCQGIAAHLLALVEREPRPWPDELREGLDRETARIAARGTRLADDLRALGHAASKAGLPLVPLKGSFLRSERYARPTLRPSADIDLLARPDDVPGWGALLRRLGYTVEQVTPRHRIFSHPTRTPVTTDGDHPDHPRPVELHERLAELVLGRRFDITSAYLAQLEHGTVLGDVPALTPGPAALGLHLVLHAGHDMLDRGLRISQLLDLRFVDGSAATVAALRAHLGAVAWAVAALSDRDVPGLLPSTIVRGVADLAPGWWRRRGILSRPGLLQGDPYRLTTVAGELRLTGSPFQVAHRVMAAWHDRVAAHDQARGKRAAGYLATLAAYLGAATRRER